MAVMYASIDNIMYLIALKLKFGAELILNGFQIVSSELFTMKDQKRVDFTKLNHLRRCQAKLSASFCRMTSGMIPELVTCMLYGTIAQISCFLLIISTAKTGQGLEQISNILLRMWGAVMTVVMPCEVGQMTLNELERTQDALLELPPAESAAGQELVLFLEATRRDLERVGDISFFTLRRSTVLAITSAVVTYIIVFIQFHVTEFDQPCETRAGANGTNCNGGG